LKSRACPPLSYQTGYGSDTQLAPDSFFSTCQGHQVRVAAGSWRTHTHTHSHYTYVQTD